MSNIHESEGVIEDNIGYGEDVPNVSIIHDGTVEAVGLANQVIIVIGGRYGHRSTNYTNWEWSTDGDPNNPFPGGMPQVTTPEGTFCGPEYVRSYVEELSSLRS